MAVADLFPAVFNDQIGADMLSTVEEMIDKLKTDNVALHGELVSEKAAHARALMDNICSQQEQKRIVEEREVVARRLAEEKSKRDHSEVIEQLKRSVAAVTWKATEEGGALTA